MEDSTKRGLIQQLAMLQNTSKHSPDSPLPGCKTPGPGDQMIYPNAPLQPTPSGSPVLSAYHLGQPSPSAQTHLEASDMATPSTQNSKIYSPNSSDITVYSPSSLSAQITPIYSPNLANAHSIGSISPYMNTSHQNTPSPSQFRQPTLQSPYLPTQRSLPPVLTPSSPFGSSGQDVRHFNTDPLQRHYLQTQPSHVQRSRGLNQARHHPYGSPQNRSSHTPQALPHGTSQPQPRDGTATPQCIYSERLESSRVYDGTPISSLPHGPMSSVAPQGVQQPHRRSVSQLLSTGEPTTSRPLPHGTPQFRSPHGASKPSLLSQGSPPLISQSASPGLLQSHVRLIPQTLGPADSASSSSPKDKLQSCYPHYTPRPHVDHTLQTPQLDRPQTASPRQQPRARVWANWLEPNTLFDLKFQAQSYDENALKIQEALLERVQQRSLSKLRAHEFLEHLTLDYNALFKPQKARVFDFYIMQALLFNKDFVLLVSSRRQKSPRVEPPQCIWGAYDLSEYRGHAEIELHIHTTLNRVTNLTPDELVLCPGHERHDSAVNAIDDEGNMQYGWSTTLCYEVKLGDSVPQLHNHSADFMVHGIRQQDIKDIQNMDPVWKAKILEVFKARKENEDALLNMEKTWR